MAQPRTKPLSPPRPSQDIVALAKEHLAQAQALPYPAGLTVHPAWRKHQEHFMACLPEITDVQTAIGFAQSRVNSGFNHRMVLDQRRILNLAAMMVNNHPEYSLGWRGLEDTPLSDPASHTDLFGARVSNIFFWHLQAYIICVKHLCPDPGSILEIGGGMGELARLFKVAHPNVRYTLVDLPESLFFAEVYLRAHFPEAFFEYGEAEEVADFRFIPVQSAAMLRPFRYDVAINQGSFQEMTAATLEYWLGFLEDSKAKALYSLNYKPTAIILSNEWQQVYRAENPPMITYDSPRDWTEAGWKRVAGLSNG